MTQNGPAGASTRRKGYESVQNDGSDDESLLVSDDSFEEVRHDKGAAHAGLPSGESEAEAEDDDDVNLLFAKGGKRTESHYEPASAGASIPTMDVPSDEQDVGQRIEQVLERERKELLSESFDTDLEDGDSNLVLSDDDDDYGIPLVRGSRGKPRVKEDRGWRSGLRAVLPLKAWWHPIPLGVVAIGMIWLAMQGLFWLRAERPRQEYVWFLLIWTGCCCTTLGGILNLIELDAD